MILVLWVLGSPLTGSARWAAGIHAQPAAILEVGTSAACAYHTLAPAIEAAQPGDTIRMQDTTFVINPTTIQSKDLTLAGGYSTAGPNGCLTQHQYGDTTLQLSLGWEDKAIWIQEATVSLSRFTFDGNADGGGGVIGIDSVLNLSYVNFGNTNGGMHASRSIVNLSHCGFYDNSNDLDGGAINAYGSSTRITLTDVEFRRNHSDARGGAIRLADGAQMEAEDCVIAGNDANEGGGLHITTDATATLRSSVVEDNQGWLHGAGASVDFGAHLTASEGTEFVGNKTPMGCDEGGGIYASDAGTQVTLDATLVMTNSALLRGGGLYVGNGAAATLIGGSVVRGNEALDPTQGDGAGAYVAGTGSHLDLVAATVWNNWSANRGGGIYNAGGTVSLDKANIWGNHAASSGGGLYNDGGTVTGQGLWMGTNVAHSGQGGGLYSQAGAVDLQQAVIYFNSALARGGGAIATFDTDLALGRSYVHHNSAASDGSVLLILGGDQAELPLARITNNMLVDNKTPEQGGTGSDVYVRGAVAHLWHNTLHRHEPDAIAVYAADGSVVSLIDNIIANFAVGIRRPVGVTGQAQATYTLYHDNTLNYDLGVLSTHNVYGDPLFVSPGNYHLAAGSPAIDAGTDAHVTADYDGQHRPVGSGFDIGADEFVVPVFLPLVAKGW